MDDSLRRDGVDGDAGIEDAVPIGTIEDMPARPLMPRVHVHSFQQCLLLGGTLESSFFVQIWQLCGDTGGCSIA